MERAKPSYLEKIKEERERLEKLRSGQPVEEEPEKVEEAPKREPLSGIPNTIMIRKSKRKFFVVANQPVVVNQVGDVLSDSAVSTASSTEESKSSETAPVSTRKYGNCFFFSDG